MKTFLSLFFIVLTTLAVAQENADPAARIETILRTNKINWSFVETPLERVIQYIRDSNKLNIVIAPTVIEALGQTKVSLQLADLSLQEALAVLLEMHDLSYMITHGVLLITGNDSSLLKPPSMMAFHKLEAMSMDTPISHLLARQLQDGIWLPYSLSEQAQISSREKSLSYAWAETNVEVIKLSIARPESWDDPANTIYAMGNHGLMVIHTAEIQQEIANFCQQWNKFSTPLIPIEVWCLEVDNALLASTQVYRAGTVEEQQFAVLTASGNARVIAHHRFSGANLRLYPLINREKQNLQSILALRPTLYPHGEVLIEISGLFAETLPFQDSSVEKTAFHNFGAIFLLPPGKIVPLAVSPLAEKRSLITLMRVTPPSWQPVVTPIEEPISPQLQEIQQKLMQQKISLNFRGAALADVIQFLSNVTGVNMVIDPKAYKGSERFPLIDMAVSELSGPDVLYLLLDPLGLSYRLEHGVVIISTKAQNSPSTVLKLYDIRDLRLEPGYDFFATGKWSDSPFSGGILCELSFSSIGVPSFGTLDEYSLSYLIMRNIATRTWEGKDTSCTSAGGILVVRQLLEVHREIAQVLEYLRQQHRHNHRLVTLWAFLAPAPDKPPTTMTLIAASNRQKVYVNGGILYLGNTPEDQRKRKEEIVYSESLQDQLEKREAVGLTITPLVKGKTIELVIEWKSWGVHGAERRLTVSVENGQTSPVATVTGEEGELTLFVGAQTIQE